jgi:hypothetical protein
VQHPLATTLWIGGFVMAVVLVAVGAMADEFSGLANPAMSSQAAGATSMGQPINNSNVVPGAPYRPLPTSRPETWPGAEKEPAYPDTSQANAATPPQNAAPATLCEDARILARVGSEVVLASEVKAYVVHEIFDINNGIHAKPPGEPSQLARGAFEILGSKGPMSENHREVLLRAGLTLAVETKLIYLDAHRKIPADNFPNVEKQLEKAFEETELPELMAVNKFNSRREFDDELRRLGSSLEWQKKIFMERSLARQWMRGAVNFDEPITHEKMLAYYQEHLADYEHPSRAKWEQLMVRFSKYPNKAAAFDALAKMGNSVKDGAPFADVARHGSDGATASQGGVRDWTSQASLVSKALDRAIFALPVGELSPIIEDEQGFHIVRVTERKDAYRTPFLETQVKIEERIRNQRIKTQMSEFLARLKAETPTSTVFDDPSSREKNSGASVTRRPGEADRR